VSHILKLTDYYELLNVSRTATDTQITKAYRRRAVQTHPDKMKNSDRRAFDKRAQAYDTLKDTNKRSLYDQLGHNTYLKTKDYSPSSSAQHHPFQDVFSNFFSTSYSPFGSSSYRTSSSSYSRMPKNRPVKYQLDVTLEQLYTGTTVKLQRQKQFHTDASSSSRRRNSSNIDIHEVTVPAGIQSGQTIRLSGEIDDNPHDTPADMIFVIQQSPHSIFTRKGNDLAMELTITIQEALCGFHNRPLSHSLSGKTLHLNSPTSNRIIKNGDVHVIEGWGMPKRHRHHQRNYGDLYIQYKVSLPNDANCMERLSTKEREQLAILLSKLSPSSKSRQHSSSNPTNEESFMQKYERKPDPEKKNDRNESTANNAVQLKESVSWKFGQSSNDEYEDDEEDDFLQEDDDLHHHGHQPFSPFFSSSTKGFQYFSTSNHSRRHQSSNPFFQSQFSSYDTNDDDGSNVQCQQM
jgi:DnaJ family protein B protein 4